MPYLRKIRRSKWYKNAEVPWLGDGELQADALTDLGTEDNKLSVYLVDDERVDLVHVIGALAFSCEHISNIDYTLILEKDLELLNINVSYSMGETPDDVVNLNHRDLTEITAKKIMALANIVKSGSIGRFNEFKIRRITAEALCASRIDRSRIKLKEDSIQKIEELANRL